MAWASEISTQKEDNLVKDRTSSSQKPSKAEKEIEKILKKL